MEEPSISRFNSQSSGRSRLSSDDGKAALDTYSSTLSAGLRGPIIQTADNKQWIDLDILSPQLLKELRRQYEPSTKDDHTSSLGKGAAKLRAFVRHSKLGLDLRLRRKLNAEQDEVTDIQLVADSISPTGVDQVTDAPWISELPATINEITELPDSSITQELDSSDGALITSIHGNEGEPLPRYEEPQRPLVAPPATLLGHVAYVQPSQSLDLLGYANNAATQRSQRPREVDDDVASNTISSIYSSREDDLLSLVEGSQQSHDERSDTPEQMAAEATRFSEGLQMIIDSLGRQTSTRQGEESEHQIVENSNIPAKPFKIASTTTYETETDAEPRVTQNPRKKPPLLTRSSRKGRKANTASTDLGSASSDSEDEPRVKPETLLRKRTIPRQLPAISGPEAIWASLIRTQSKILGPEHPLVYRAKSDWADSRANSHAKGSNDLTSLIKSRIIAIDTLGSTHPWVAAFIGDLETLGGLLRMDVDKSVATDEKNATVTPKDPDPPSQGPQAGNSDMLNDVQAPQHNKKASEVQPEDSSQAGASTAQALGDDPSNMTAEATNLPLPSGEANHALPKIVTSFHPIGIGGSPAEASATQPAQLDALWNSWQPPHQPMRGVFSFPKLAFGAAMGFMADGMLWLQRNYGPEQPVESGKVRVRWTCSCGAQLHDDFIERRIGAARELEAYLNRPKAHAGGNGTSPTSPSSSQGTHSLANSSFGVPPSSQTSWSSYGSLGQGATDSSGKGPRTYAGLPLHSQNSPFVEPPWLLTSTNEDRDTPKLSHLDMSPLKVRSDKDLALSLREHYFAVNKKWWRGFRVRGLTTIEFVQFEVHRNRFADIRKSPDMPTSLNEDYSFEPADLLPPVGSQYLLHLFKHPEDYDDERVTYLRAPKKHSRLHIGVGWGINLVEGFRADRLWLFVSSLFAFGSLIFAVVWSFEKHNVQSASGIAAWIVSLGVLVIGWMQACLG